jgi:hypothetical protein
MQLALEALYAIDWEDRKSGHENAIDALRDRLAQPEPDSVLDKREQAQELRELADRFSEGWHDGIKIDASDIVLLTDVANAIEQLLYTAPVHAIDIPQERVDETVKDRHEWVGLTDEEIVELSKSHGTGIINDGHFARAIKARLRDKNT